jgi:hypothetical protein
LLDRRSLDEPASEQLAQSAVEQLLIEWLLELAGDHLRARRLAVVRLKGAVHGLQQRKGLSNPVHVCIVAQAADGTPGEENAAAAP